VRAFLDQFDAQRQLAALGHAQCVAREVEHDLAHARGVAREARRHAVMHPARERDALLVRRVREQRGDGVDGDPHVEVHARDLELARLDARVVEDVVDQLEQVLPGILDDLGERRLVAVEPRVEQQAAHPDHAVHRRAQLVRHRGEERRLELRAGARLGEPRLGHAHVAAQPLELGVIDCRSCAEQRYAERPFAAVHSRTCIPTQCVSCAVRIGASM
jgi:hypothetical protein